MASYIPTGSFVNAANSTATNQVLSGATRLADGRLVLVWHTNDTAQDGSSSAVKMRLFSSTGVPLGDETLVNTVTGGDQTFPTVTALADGGFVVAWVSSGSVDGIDYSYGIEAQTFDATGAKVGSEFRVNSSTIGTQTNPVTTALADGGFLVAWETADTAQDGSGRAIKAQLYSAAGVAVGGEFLVNSTAAGNQWKADAAGLSDGGFVVTWHTGNDANSEIYAQRYGSDGTALGGEILVSQDLGRQTDASIAALPGGGFVITWMTNDLAEWSDYQIRAQVFDASGNKVGTEFTANSNPVNSQMMPDVAALADGTFAISWGESGAQKVRAFDGSGQPLGPETVISTSSGDYAARGGELVATADGGLAFAWAPFHPTTFDSDPRLQLLKLNAAPELGNPTRTVSAAENGTTVTTVTSTDDGGPAARSYTIVGGADAAMFTLTASTGLLRFVSPHNYEAPNDADLNNAYEVVVQVSDGDLVDTQAIAVNVTNVNEAPTITSNGGGASAAVTIDENSTAVTTVAGVDAEPSTLSYSLAGGADMARFTIVSSTGVLRFVTAPNFEAPTDAGANNVYDVIVRASDGILSDTQAIAVTVANANDAPVITSNGGNIAASIYMQENGTAVTTVTSTDADNNPRSYFITGGTDAALFAIDASTGVLGFLAAPDFEAPGDANADNAYQVIVQASDGALADSQTVWVNITNRNEGLSIVSPSEWTIDENQTAVGAIQATDLDGTAPAYAIAGGADAALFAVDATTGALSFVAAPDFDIPSDADGDNLYEVAVSASDGSFTDTDVLSVTVGDVAGNASLTFPDASYGIYENENAIIGLYLEGATGYAITGGADAALFSIPELYPSSLIFGARDFEAPADADGDHVYEVEITAWIGEDSGTATYSVTVADDNEGYYFFSPEAWAAAENETAVGTVVADDLHSDEPITYTLLGSDDAALFWLDATTGEFGFHTAPNFEAPGDADGDNVYELLLAATWNDGGNHTALQTLTITVGDVDTELPRFVTGAAYAMTENDGYVGQVEAVDPNGGAVDYQLLAGADRHLFSIDPLTGELTFVAAPDFEAPADADGDNIYEVTVVADNGEGLAYQSLSVEVSDGNDEPVIVSHGGGYVALTVTEGLTAATTVAATDADGDSVTYGLIGPDAARFTVDATTGVLNFLAAPDFEAPGDTNGDNVYAVSVTASDGSLMTAQPMSITVGNVNEGLSITSSASALVLENETAVATVTAADLDGDEVGFAIAGGADAALFAIDAASGALSFTAAPDFEAPGDADGDNVYEVVVGASDGSLLEVQTVAVSVTNRNDSAPVLTPFQSDTVVSAMAENDAAYFDFGATDADGDAAVFSLSGQDAASFAVDAATGFVQFLAAPDFEAPGSSQGTNSYVFDVIASDGTYSDVLHVTLHISDTNEPVTITSGGGGAAASVAVDENGTAVTTVVASDPELAAPAYAIDGGADAALFAIDSATGALSFLAAADFEAPADANGDNAYEVTVSTSDGTHSDSQAISVTVGNSDEAPVIDSDGGGTSAALELDEGQVAVTTVVGQDPDGAGPLTYAITGGADAALFALDAGTGALSFVAAPDYEAPADQAAGNFYNVTVSVSDGALTSWQAVSVLVRNVNEGVAITSAAAASATENATAVTTVTASDIDGDAIVFSIAGGADSALFTLDAETGALSFLTAPDFEAPADADGDNVYDVIVSASDGSLTDSQSLAVTVDNANEAPVITSGGGGASANYALNENATAIAAIAAGDPEGGVTYSLAGGADAARFAIDASTGALSFVAAPDFDAPTDANANNVYELIVSASDGSFSDSQALAITVGNLSDGLTLTGTSKANTLSGSYEEDTISGLGGNDTLLGLAAADTLNGGDGADRLIGGAGADVLTGGSKADIFEFEALADSTFAAWDRIVDFTRSQGDRIELVDIDANVLVGGNQAFSFIGTAAFSNQAGQLRYFQQDGDTFVAGDVDGNGAADFQIVVDPLVSFVASDFLL